MLCRGQPLALKPVTKLCGGPILVSQSRHLVHVKAMAGQGSHMTCSCRELDGALERLQALPAPRYVVFTSDPVNGVYWCPDCVRALPAIKRTMQEKGCSLLEVLVGERAVWKDAAHPLRQDPRFLLSGVPTLIHITDAGSHGAKLGGELEAAASPVEVVALTAKFVNQTSG